MALRDVRIAIELDYDLPSAYYHLGLILNSLEKNEEAQLNFTKAIQLDPSMSSAYYNRARLHYNSGNLESAVADLSEAISIVPNSGDFYILRGQIYLIQGNKRKATIDLEKVISLSGKEEIIVAKKKEGAVINKQKEIAVIKIQGKTLNQLTQNFGKSDFIREDGNTKTVRFNASTCRLFVYFNLEIKKPKAEYYEIRNTKGELIDKKEEINKCFKEIQKT